jgi:hypothetical protein
MGSIADLVPLMSPEERKDVRELDSRVAADREVDLYWRQADNSLLVEVLPSNAEELPFGLKVLKPEAVQEVYMHPYSFVGDVALRAVWQESNEQAA